MGGPHLYMNDFSYYLFSLLQGGNRGTFCRNYSFLSAWKEWQDRWVDGWIMRGDGTKELQIGKVMSHDKIMRQITENVYSSNQGVQDSDFIYLAKTNKQTIKQTNKQISKIGIVMAIKKCK